MYSKNSRLILFTHFARLGSYYIAAHLINHCIRYLFKDMSMLKEII